MKALGQVGLDFIAGKYKELKNSLKDYAKKSNLDKKIDKSQISTNVNDMDADKVASAMSTSMLYGMISKHKNIYLDEDKAKVKAIPTNPKYTDTVTEVVDNLTTSDSTKALSAKQGKVLNDSLSGKADKSNISRCKTKGYSSASSWSSVSSSRDLEDWIGDFDKRTRELKSGGGAELKVLTSYNQYASKMANEWMLLKIGNYVIASYMGIQGMSDFTYNVDIPVGFRPKKDVYVAYATPDKRGGAVVTGFTLQTNGKVSVPGASNDWFVGNFTLIYECA